MSKSRIVSIRLKKKEVITYAQNERQQKPSQNYPYRLRISNRREAGTYCLSDCFEIASIQKAIEEQKNTLKEKKTALKKAEKGSATPPKKVADAKA